MAEYIEAAMCDHDSLLTTLPNRNFYPKAYGGHILYCSGLETMCQRTDRETKYRGHSNPDGLLGWAGQ